MASSRGDQALAVCMSNEFYFCEMLPRPELHGAGLQLRALCRRAVCPGSTLSTVVCRLLLKHVNHDVRHQIWLTVARGGLCVVEDEAMCVRAVFTAMKQRCLRPTVGMPSLGAPMPDDDVCASRGFRLLVAGVIRTDKAKKRRLHAENPTEFIKRVLRENPPMIPKIVHCRHVVLRWFQELRWLETSETLNSDFATASRGNLKRHGRWLKRELGEMVAAVRGAQASGDEGKLRAAATLFVSSYVFLQLWFAADLRYASKEHERWCMQVQSVHKRWCMQVQSVRTRMPNLDAASQEAWDACRGEAHFSTWLESMLKNAEEMLSINQQLKQACGACG